MKMRHKSPTLCTIANKFITQQIWFNGTYTITSDSLYIIQSLN